MNSQLLAKRSLCRFSRRSNPRTTKGVMNLLNLNASPVLPVLLLLTVALPLHHLRGQAPQFQGADAVIKKLTLESAQETKAPGTNAVTQLQTNIHEWRFSWLPWVCISRLKIITVALMN